MNSRIAIVVLILVTIVSIAISFLGFVAILFELMKKPSSLAEMLMIVLGLVYIGFGVIVLSGLLSDYFHWISEKWKTHTWLTCLLCSLFQGVLIMILCIIKFWRMRMTREGFSLGEMEDVSLLFLSMITFGVIFFFAYLLIRRDTRYHIQSVISRFPH